MTPYFSKFPRAARTVFSSALIASLFLAAPFAGAKSPDVPTEAPAIDRHGIADADVAEGFKKDIAAFRADDAKSPPAPGGILFVGSSTIRLWKPTMAEQFPDLPWINRGFGGGRTWECLYFFDEIVTPYKPRLIVYFCGTNDTVDPKRTPESTVQNTRAFLDLVRTKLPGTRVLYLSLTKAPSRRNVWHKMDAVNRDMAGVIKADPAAAWFDMNSLVFDEKGEPRMDLYREDQLHLNAAGYTALSNAIRPLIDEQLKKTE